MTSESVSVGYVSGSLGIALTALNLYNTTFSSITSLYFLLDYLILQVSASMPLTGPPNGMPGRPQGYAPMSGMPPGTIPYRPPAGEPPQLTSFAF